MNPTDGSSIGLPHFISGIALTAVLGLWRLITGKAGKDELAKAIESFEQRTAAVLERVDEHYEEARESRERLYDKFDELNKGVGATMVALSRLQGQLDKNER